MPFVIFPLPYAFLFLVTFLHCQNKINPTAVSTRVSFSIVLQYPISFKIYPKYVSHLPSPKERRESAERASKSVNLVLAHKCTLKSLVVELTYLHFLPKILCILSIFFNTILIIHYFLGLKSVGRCFFQENILITLI